MRRTLITVMGNHKGASLWGGDGGDEIKRVFWEGHYAPQFALQLCTSCFFLHGGQGHHVALLP